MVDQYGPHADKDRSTDFGRWLTERREAAKLKQQGLAVLLGNRLGRDVHSGRISEWEQGQKVPPTDVVVALKAILDPAGPEPPIPQRAVTDQGTLQIDLELPV